MNDSVVLLTVLEVAEILRVDQTTVRRWVKQGILQAVILPHAGDRRSIRILKSTVNQLLEPTPISA